MIGRTNRPLGAPRRDPQPERKNFWHKVFGRPIANSKAQHEKLPPSVGLAVFASDSLSSVAYATEAILSVLVLISATALGIQPWISLTIVALIAIIAFSYRQTIRAYPQGGGSYIVASDNLGPGPGTVAGAALLIDYTLTVAVSVAAGVAAVISAFPQLHEYLVPLSCVFIVLLAWANLRGMKESGALFAIPTYGFVIVMYVMIIYGFVKTFGMPIPQQTVIAEPGKIGSEADWPLAFVLLRAFAAGCTALTGIEAVSDGTQAFRKPEQKNASNTLVRMAVILSTLFLGLGFLVTRMPEISLYSAKNPEFRTVNSQIASFVFGSGSAGFSSSKHSPRSSFCWPPIRRSRTFPGFVVSSPATVFFLAICRGSATGLCFTTASSCWRYRPSPS